MNVNIVIVGNTKWTWILCNGGLCFVPLSFEYNIYFDGLNYASPCLKLKKGCIRIEIILTTIIFSIIAICWKKFDFCRGPFLQRQNVNGRLKKIAKRIPKNDDVWTNVLIYCKTTCVTRKIINDRINWL